MKSDEYKLVEKLVVRTIEELTNSLLEIGYSMEEIRELILRGAPA